MELWAKTSDNSGGKAPMREPSGTRPSLTRIQELVELLPDAVVGVVAGRIVLVNAQAESMLGYGLTELVGQPVETLLPDGPVEITVSKLETDGGTVALAAIREQSRELEGSSPVSALAHDFSNILGVILNYAQFVAEEIGEESPARPDVEEIRRAAERGVALTRELRIKKTGPVADQGHEPPPSDTRPGPRR